MLAKKSLVWIVIMMMMVSAISACSQTPTPVPSPAEVVEPMEVAEAVEDEVVEPEAPLAEEAPASEESLPEPEPEPEERLEDVLTGPYLEKINFFSEPSAEAAVAGFLEGKMDVYGYTIHNNPELFTEVLESGLNYAISMGGYTELVFNTAGPDLRDGSVNPFVVPAIREAMNMLLDREYIVGELLGGLGLPKYTILSNFSPDYSNLNDTVTELENKYAHDLEVADARISAEMIALGAVQENDLWTYNGQPVELIFLIREGDRMVSISEYAASQLEAIGFQVRRVYVDSGTANQLWMRGDPLDGGWHVYITSWFSTAIARDQGGDFLFFYSPNSSFGAMPLWQTYQISDRFEALCQALDTHKFDTFEERSQMMREALILSMENSSHVWLVDETAFTPYSESVSVKPSLATGILGSDLWPHTLRFTDQIGGEMNIAVPSLLTEPWNPISGSTWVFETNIQKAIGDDGTIFDPETDLMLPQRIERAEIFAQEGLPIRTTDDWVRLEFTPKIRIPDDAWADWDAANQVFITSAEKAAELGESYLTARIKSTVFYPDDLFETIRWHDGSQLSMADFVTYMILLFDRTSPESPIFDETLSANFAPRFKGLRIVSEAPLIIEYYTDNYQLDAENNVYSFWPKYPRGEGAWHTVSLGILAEINGNASFSRDKAAALGVAWLGYTHGPSMEILRQVLGQASQEMFIPYEPTLKDYLSEEEVDTRYKALSDWYDAFGHFWVGTGPYMLSQVDVDNSSLTLVRNEMYPDVMGKWDTISEVGRQ